MANQRLALSPASVGIGWRSPHQQALLAQRPPLDFIEVHSENFFAPGGPALAALLQARQSYPLSLHGVGLALGSAAGLDLWHLDQLARLVRCVEPALVSDHASWARAPQATGGPVLHAADLLPLSFTRASLALMLRHVQQVQERLGRQIGVENLSACLVARDADFSEAEFFRLLARHSGCTLLLDVNNLVVNALNAGCADPAAQAVAWIDELEPRSVSEIHLAGYNDSGPLVIDDHGSRVRPEVWRVYEHAIRRLGPVPTLVEWDTDVPAFEVLLGEAWSARERMQVGCHEPA